jgi:hypothetical protein
MATLMCVRRKNERGQAIIELALTLPLLLLVVMGIFDFGLMFQRYEVVTNAAREGARVGVLPNYPPAQAEARAIQYLDLGGLGGASITTRPCGGAEVPGSRCASAQVLPTTIPAAGGAPAVTLNEIVVTVEYDHEHVFVGPMMSLFGGSIGTTRLRSVSRMRLETN